MFACEESAQGDAGHREEGDEVAGEDHQPGPPGVVGEEHQDAGHQVQVTHHHLQHVTLSAVRREQIGGLRDCEETV